ncbi:tripartite tricarboxylate transporter substrate binding protein [Ramlibacter sp. G-1-2-2]|uniref:Tripartite tricarboxylate transporter substrate binding protein n=1 Tax=Ramlibacter agri TaxID=2728837 RepID=A0A848H597_9BURK|nr:tripartite tricarboxylate transporter substrate binding protein [Ramlibacter agri]NML46166.1 tripartite tricarboxylate transporter substrate binding protein [Ramlibacter agri]
MAPSSIRRALLGAALASTPLFALAQQAANFPNKAIRIVVAAAPGGTSDILARLLGQKLSEKWGQPVLIDNRPGADSNVGADLAAKAAPDGYTLLLLDVSTLTMGPSLYPKLSYNPRTDFAPVTMVIFSPHAVAVHAGLPVNNVKELVAWSKANPGKLNFGSSSNATRLAAARLNLATGMDMVIVPYKGGAQAITATSGGESNIMMSSLLSVMPHLKNGRLKALAVASERRMEAEPNIPTVLESGVKDYVTGSWQGLLAPAHTPPDVVKKLNAAFVEILRTPEIQKQLVAQGAEVVADTPEHFGAFLKEDTEKWTKVVKDANIKVDQ